MGACLGAVTTGVSVCEGLRAVSLFAALVGVSSAVMVLTGSARRLRDVEPDSIRRVAALPGLAALTELFALTAPSALAPSSPAPRRSSGVPKAARAAATGSPAAAP